MLPSDLEAAISRIENPPPVLTKHDFVRRYSLGEFGNRSPTWDTIHEAIRDDLFYSGLIHIRNRVAGAETWYNVDPTMAMEKYQECLSKGWKPDQLYFSLMAPTEKTICQGEVFQSADRGLALYYTTVAKPMREALKENAIQVYGIRAVETLKYYVDPSSYDWLQVLLERYPSHVVEFSTYSVELGTVPGMRTIFWEVRMY